MILQQLPKLGALALYLPRAWRAYATLLIATLAGAWRRRQPAAPAHLPGELARLLFQMMNRSVVFITLTLGFLGMVMIYQASLQMTRVVGDFAATGAQFMRLGVSDFAPTLTAMMLATRLGAGIAAELGAMKATEQLDALTMTGVAPIDFLVAPRLLACVLATLTLSIWGTMIMMVAGALTSTIAFGGNFFAFFDVRATQPVHVAIGLLKATAYGTVIAIVSSHKGLAAQGSSAGVGEATTHAVIGSSLGVLAADFAISALAYAALGTRL